MANQQNNPQFVVTGRARLSYVSLFTPKAGKNGSNPKFGVTILLPKSDIATKQRIDTAIQAAIAAGVASKWNGMRPPQPAIPVYDGDGVRPSDGMTFGPECKGHWVFTATTDATKRKPEIIDANSNPIIDQSEIYSGIYGRVSVNFAAYNKEGKKGIGCYLNNVQKLEDGEPLAGSYSSATDDFGGGYAPVPMPQPYQPPYQQPVVAPQPYQPPYQQPVVAPQPVEYDPITGRPITGQVMGI